MNNTTLFELVQRDQLELMMRAPFFGRLICSAEIVWVRSPQVRIACTDYRRIFLSADSYPELPEEQRLAVLAHEVLHIALRHAFRIGNREPNRFGMAADIEVHFLLRENFQEPYRIRCKEEWSELTVEQIYDLLPVSTQRQAPSDHCYPAPKRNPYSQGASSSGDGSGKPEQREDGPASQGSPTEPAEGADTESQDNGDSTSSRLGEDADPQSQPVPGQPGSGRTQGTEIPSMKGTGQEPQDSEPQPQQDGDAAQAGRELSEFCPHFEADSEMTSRMQTEELRLDLKQKTRRGNVPAGLEIRLEKLSQPRVCWRALLRQFIRLYRGGAYCWLPPNRRFVAKELYLPGRRDKLFRGVVALDTSRSTMDRLGEFVAELTALLRSFGKFELTVIECDAQIQQVWKISQYDRTPDFAKHHFKGGGGTDFAPVFAYVRDNIRNPNVLIFFTDGDGKCPQCRPPYPVLWLLTDDGKAPVSWGTPIYYKEA